MWSAPDTATARITVFKLDSNRKTVKLSASELPEVSLGFMWSGIIRKNRSFLVPSKLIEITQTGEIYQKLDLTSLKATRSSWNTDDELVAFVNGSKDPLDMTITIDDQTGAMDCKIVIK